MRALSYLCTLLFLASCAPHQPWVHEKTYRARTDCYRALVEIARLSPVLPSRQAGDDTRYAASLERMLGRTTAMHPREFERFVRLIAKDGGLEIQSPIIVSAEGTYSITTIPLRKPAGQVQLLFSQVFRHGIACGVWRTRPQTKPAPKPPTLEIYEHIAFWRPPARASLFCHAITLTTPAPTAY